MFKKIVCFFFILFFSLIVSAMSVGERRAVSVPKNYESNMNQIVHYLVDNINDRTEQANAIAVWIATHVAYDHDANAAYRIGTHKNGQAADDVFKNRVGICLGFSELYEKMLKLAGIKSEKVYGFVVEKSASKIKAKTDVKHEKIGHVWNKVIIPGRPALNVDVTWMARGKFGGDSRKKSDQARKREFRKNKRENKTYQHEMTYFGFSYPELEQRGEFRFDNKRQAIKK